MELLKNDNRRFALAAAGALAFTAGGILLGQTLFDTSPDAAEPAGEAGEHGEAEENHGPEGFVAIDGARAQAAGIITEIVRSGGLGSEIIAQGVVAATPEGESVLTARADGTVVRINRRLGDYVNAGQAVAVMESREASSIASERSAAAARLALARSTYDREKRLYDAKVTARQDLEGAQAALAEAQAEVRRTQAAAGAARRMAAIALPASRVLLSVMVEAPLLHILMCCALGRPGRCLVAQDQIMAAPQQLTCINVSLRRAPRAAPGRAAGLYGCP